MREMERRREREIARERQRQREIERKQKEEALRLQRERERLQSVVFQCSGYFHRRTHVYSEIYIARPPSVGSAMYGTSTNNLKLK